ncbi:MAG: class II fructose-bisphosphate aldolase [Firmicutes bacterium]|nr:class II fructose-bisphosphate aldolase [Bacillota bacterium]
MSDIALRGTALSDATLSDTTPRDITLRELLYAADRGGYAIPAFNYSDIWDLLAIVRAAEREKAPVILASNPLVVGQIGAELVGPLGKAVEDTAAVPVIHHLDHSETVELCLKAIDVGFKSVMIDASKQPLEKNIRTTRRVADYAHQRGVSVEGELGRIKGRGFEGGSGDEDFLIRVDEAVRFVEETRVDSLAVGIGTAHGFYKGKPEINFKRLDEVNRAVSIPLVLHGGTGIPAEDVREAIRLGINKVNVGTMIHSTYMNAMREELVRRGPSPYTLDVVKPVLEKITDVVAEWIRVCMASGRAAGLSRPKVARKANLEY